jgi:RNA polymerase-binding transcription factor DksA
MRKIQSLPQNKHQMTSSNLLNDFHIKTINMPITLRNTICEECGWSIPTYYRKCRGNAKNGIAYSNAEEKMILDVYLETLRKAIRLIEKHKPALAKN